MENLKITFNLDGTGVYYDLYEPTHLDGLLGWVAANRRGMEAPARDELPLELELPLAKWEIAGQWGWRASAVFPLDDSGESLRFIRKRITQDRLQITSDCSISTANGEYRSHNIPIPLLMARGMTAYAVGERRGVEDLLSDIKYLGRYTKSGFGRVVGVTVEAIADDYTLTKEGRAMRYLPHAEGFRQCRTRAPYWNNCGRVAVCEVGDDYTL